VDLRRAVEISLIIKQVFETAIMTELAPRTQIDIFVTVLQVRCPVSPPRAVDLMIPLVKADGGTRTAGINAVTLALIDAGIPMRDFVVACAAGLADNTPLMGPSLNFCGFLHVR